MKPETLWRWVFWFLLQLQRITLMAEENGVRWWSCSSSTLRICCAGKWKEHWGLWFFNFFPFLYLLFWLCLYVFLVLCLNSSGAAEERRWKIMIFWCKCGISLNILFNCKRWQQIMYIYDIYFQNIVWKLKVILALQS